MSNIEVKLRRGTTAQHSTFTGAEGEVTVDTDKDTVIVHDGTTTGGHELRKKSDTIDGSEIDAGAITHDKISTADAVFKINSSDQIRIGGDLSDTALESISQVGVTSSSANAVMTIESTGATNDGVLVCTAQQDAIIQLKDASQSSTDKGIYNISSSGGKLAIGSIAAGGGGVNIGAINFERKTLSAVDYIVPSLINTPTFADNSAAVAGGLSTKDVYKTSTGELRIVV